MYLSSSPKPPQPLDFYPPPTPITPTSMLIEIPTPTATAAATTTMDEATATYPDGQNPNPTYPDGQNPKVSNFKKRAENWAQDESRLLLTENSNYPDVQNGNSTYPDGLKCKVSSSKKRAESWVQDESGMLLGENGNYPDGQNGNSTYPDGQSGKVSSFSKKRAENWVQDEARMLLSENGSYPDGQSPKVPNFKKRAETWAQDETRVLIGLRREIDSLFNTSKSNKHLWDQISVKMREKGFDRSPTMCTDKWRNLLKEFKKAKGSQESSGGGGKMSYYEEIEEILRDRCKNGGGGQGQYKSNSPKVDPFMQFSDKGIDDTSITFGPVEANGRSALNLESQLDQEGHPLAITAADTVAANGASPWNWRETPGNGDPGNSYGGRVILIKLGDYTRRIGIDGTPDAIKETIKAAFRLRTSRAFWLEDEDNVVRTLDRDMPLGNYTLHIDEGLTIKVCLYEDPNQMPVHAEDKTFYSEDDFRNFLSRRGWICLREYNGFRNVDTMDELCPGEVYRGIRLQM